MPPTKLHTPDDVKQIQARIATIKAGGGTSILPPLEAAFEAAAASDAPLKHIVLMTDGESNDRGYEDLLARMSANHITLSTLAIGSDADTRLLTTWRTWAAVATTSPNARRRSRASPARRPAS